MNNETQQPPVGATPRTDAACQAIQRSGVDWHHSAKLVADHARALECELTALQQWKDSAIEVESSWSPWRVAKLLELPLGSCIRKGIEPVVMNLLADKKRLDWLMHWNVSGHPFKTRPAIDSAMAHQVTGNNTQTIIGRLLTIGNPELAELLRLHHRTPDYREALVNEALARLLTQASNVSASQLLEDVLNPGNGR